ncbi:unnamed protein product, partial [Effrenium voratum]
CVFFYPGNVRPVWVQLAVFLAAEHVVLLLQATVQAVIPEEPKDVKDIRFYNDHVKTFLQHKSREKHAPPAVTDLRHVNLSLNPDGVESECESSSS